MMNTIIITTPKMENITDMAIMASFDNPSGGIFVGGIVRTGRVRVWQVRVSVKRGGRVSVHCLTFVFNRLGNTEELNLEVNSLVVSDTVSPGINKK